MDEFVLPHCSKISISFRGGELLIEQDCDQADGQCVNVPADRVPAFLDAIKQLCDANSVTTESKPQARMNGHSTLHN